MAQDLASLRIEINSEEVKTASEKLGALEKSAKAVASSVGLLAKDFDRTAVAAKKVNKVVIDQIRVDRELLKKEQEQIKLQKIKKQLETEEVKLLRQKQALEAAEAAASQKRINQLKKEEAAQKKLNAASRSFAAISREQLRLARRTAGFSGGGRQQFLRESDRSKVTLQAARRGLNVDNIQNKGSINRIVSAKEIERQSQAHNKLTSSIAREEAERRRLLRAAERGQAISARTKTLIQAENAILRQGIDIKTREGAILVKRKFRLLEAAEADRVLASATQKTNRFLERRQRDLQNTVKQQERYNRATRTAAVSTNRFADRLGRAAAAVSIIEGPLGGTASRMLTFSTLISEVNLLTAAAVIGFAALGAAVTAIGFAVAKAADEMKLLSARMELIIGNANAVGAAMRSLGNIAKNTGTSIADSLQVLQRLNIGIQDIGGTTTTSFALLETVQQLGAISGAGTANLRAGLLQFSQALSSGIVRAEEFNSIVENIPEVAKAIADGLGLSVGQLRNMVKEGKILAADVLDALLVQTFEIEERFNKLPKTIGRAFNELKVTAQETAAEFDKQTEFTQRIAEAISSVNTAFESLQASLPDLIASASALLETLLLFSGIKVIQLGIIARQNLMTASFNRTTAAVSLFNNGLITSNQLSLILTSRVTAATLATRALAASFIVLRAAILGVAGVLAFLQFREFERGKQAIEGAKRSLESLEDSMDAVVTKTVLNNAKLIEAAQSYDRLAGKTDRTNVEQKNFVGLADSLNERLAKQGTTIDKLIEKYGDLTTAIQNMLSVTAIQTRVSEIDRQVAQNNLAIRAAGEARVRQQGAAGVGAIVQGKNDTLIELIERVKSAVQSGGQEELQFIEAIRKENSLLLQEKIKLNRLLPTAGDSEVGKKIRDEITKTGTETETGLTDKEIDKINKFNMQLENQERLREALNKKVEEGTILFEREKRIQEALKTVADKNLKLTAEQTKEFANRIIKLKDLEQIQKIKGKALDVSDAISDNLELAKAAEKGVIAFQKQKDIIDARNQALKLVAGLNPETATALQKALTPGLIAQKESERQINQSTVGADTSRKATQAEELAVAAAKSRKEFFRVTQAQKISNALLKVGLTLEDEKGKELAENLRRIEAANQQTEQSLQLRDANQELQQLRERNELIQQGLTFDKERQEFVFQGLDDLIIKQQAHNQALMENGEVNKELEAILIKVGRAQRDIGLAQKRQQEGINALNNAFQQFGRAIENQFVDALRTGQFSFREFTVAILEDISRMILRMSILNTLFGGQTFGGKKTGILTTFFTNLFNPAGAAVSTASKAGSAIGGFPTPFAKGGILGGPTLLDGGRVLGGEAGPEGVLPLQRLRDGSLGVRTSGNGGNNTVINNQVNVSVEASGGTTEQNEELANKIGLQVNEQLKGMIRQELSKQQRPGGMLNRGNKI